MQLSSYENITKDNIIFKVHMTPNFFPLFFVV